MMQLLNKKRKLLGNKGFSLVELIIVIAIMAVLIAILVPQYLQYVEKSKMQADGTAADTILNAVRVASSDATITYTANDVIHISWAKAGTLTNDNANYGAISTAVAAALGATGNDIANFQKPMTAAGHKTAYVVTITIDATGIPTVTDNKTNWDQGK